MNVVSNLPSPVTIAARGSWSGLLKLDSIIVPVKGYSAAVTQRDSPLHLVHAKCGSRIQQPRRCPKHGEIASDQVVKAFEFAPDDDVVLTEDDLNQLKPYDDQTIHIERLLPARQLNPFLLSGRTLNLIPARAAAADAYQLVVTAFARADEWAIGRLVMSDRQQLVALRVVDQRLVLHVLHWPAQWRACLAFDATKPSTLADVERLSVSLAPLRLEELVSAGASTIGKLIQESSRAATQHDTRAALLHLIANGRLDVDLLSAPISDQSVPSPGGSISWEPFDSVWGPCGSWTDGPSASSANSVPTNLLFST